MRGRDTKRKPRRAASPGGPEMGQQITADQQPAPVVWPSIPGWPRNATRKMMIEEEIAVRLMELALHQVPDDDPLVRCPAELASFYHAAAFTVSDAGSQAYVAVKLLEAQQRRHPARTADEIIHLYMDLVLELSFAK